MRSSQQTSFGFDTDSDPRLQLRQAAAQSQRATSAEPAEEDRNQTRSDAQVSGAGREPEAVGARSGEGSPVGR